MTTPKTTRKPMAKTTRSTTATELPQKREKQIIRDLAERIEQRGRERFAVKSANIRKRLMDVMESAWPNSNDETLAALAVNIINQSEPDDAAIFAEIRELNSGLLPSERMVPCPLED